MNEELQRYWARYSQASLFKLHGVAVDSIAVAVKRQLLQVRRYQVLRSTLQRCRNWVFRQRLWWGALHGPANSTALRPRRETDPGLCPTVKPICQTRQDLDAIDAEAICEDGIATKPCRFVPIGTARFCQEHRWRRAALEDSGILLVKWQRTQSINSLRGHLSELGIHRGQGDMERVEYADRDHSADKTYQRIPAVAPG